MPTTRSLNLVRNRRLWTLLIAVFGCLSFPCTGSLRGADPETKSVTKNNDSEGTGDPLDPGLLFEKQGIELSLVAEHPDLATPTGIDVDDRGAVWVVANHTHFRPEKYDGPEHDEILVFHPDGQRTVFYNDTDATMDLELGPDGWVYVAQRDRILRIRDSNQDGRGDKEETIANLETEADYPHNGLSGLTWSIDGDLVFSIGENYAKPWTLTGTDGSNVAGSGEGGIFVCRPDGGQLRRIAKGFWNPFGVCVRDDGTMFAAENDPGSRPPCRLLQIVPGGDYGYQRRYGSAAYHPFVCWNGELPGTLPMLHAAGEAPCGIAALGNGLVVPSWTEHRIDFFPLQAQGASFTTERVTLIRGGDYFRPTCITAQSDTTFYLTDWVVGSYALHGKGRVWKLTIDPRAADWLGKMDLRPATDMAKLAESLRNGQADFSIRALLEYCRQQDPFIRSAAIDALSRKAKTIDAADRQAFSVQDTTFLLLANKKADPKDQEAAESFLAHANPAVQLEALRWIADHEMTGLLPQVRQQLVSEELSYRVFEATVATLNALSGKPELGVSDPNMLIALLQDPEISPRIRSFALRLLDPRHPKFSPELWDEWLHVDDQQALTELVRSVATVGTPAAQAFLIRIASDATMSVAIRADAVSGISSSDPEAASLLVGLAESDDPTLREEALRSLRFATLGQSIQNRLKRIGEQHPASLDLVQAALDPASLKRSRPKPDDLIAWRRRLANVEQPVDREAGRRTFHHSAVGTCLKCHRHSGRGTDLGPDLTAVSSLGDKNRLLLALLQPSRDVDPQYHPRRLVTEDGRVFTGILLRDGGGGKEYYRDDLGREQMLKTSEIVQRKELDTSMMPDGLFELMTDREIRDLLAFIDNEEATVLVGTTTSPWIGAWWLDFDDAYGGWLQIQRLSDQYEAKLLWRVGSAQPVEIKSISDQEIVLTRRRRKQAMEFIARREGESIRIQRVGSEEQARGQLCPPMPPRPDLSKIQFGEPISLFNGRDLEGWKLQPAKAENGWRVSDGVLINETPKTDFSAYGSYGNLRSEKMFGDCRLHVEFNVGKKGNSGIYVNGLYEAQVVDRDSPMQGINGPGAVFGRIEPSLNAGLPGDQWQSYDITLVDRHLTIKLNDKLVIDNQPVVGCTGGALFGNVTRKGPLYLQGDHTSVRYRNLQIRPRIQD